MDARRLLTWVLFAALALIAAWLAQLHIATRFEAQRARDQVAITDLALQSARQELEAERLLARGLARPVPPANDGSRLILGVLSPEQQASPVPFAVVAWDTLRQEGSLRAYGLPSPGPDADYQLWLTDPAYPDKIDAGVLIVDTQTGRARLDFSPRRPVEAGTSFEITRERKGGAPAPAGPVVLKGRPPF